MAVRKKDQLFELGKVVMTEGIRHLLQEDDTQRTFIEIAECVDRHKSGDWGDLCEEDAEMNDSSIALEQNGDYPCRIMSVYSLSDGTIIWIITERDRSATTILLPEEY